MNYIEVTQLFNWFKPRKFKATWDTLEGDSFSKEFKNLGDLIEWARINAWWLDSRPGGGYGPGVQLWMGDYLLAEFYLKEESNKYKRNLGIQYEK